MSRRPSPTFPRTLTRLWSHTDPASETVRTSDALDRPTMHRRVTTDGGDYWVCSETGQLEHTVLIPPAPDAYDGHWREMVERGEPTAKQKRSAKELLERFAPYRTHGRMFEIATGLGPVVEMARDLGWQPEGIEFSPFAAQHTTDRTGIPVQVGPAEAMQLEENAYDLVIMDNLFEHLTQPRHVLHTAAKALRPGGVIYLQTLNAQCLSLHAQPLGWIYFAPGHQFVPTRLSFQHYLDHCGLEFVFRTTRGFRPRPQRDEHDINGVARSYEKIVSHLARATHTGHRIECILRRKAQ
ncbi:MAG: class I SAM-dependent methyltransferase [Planctomycetota bacterium]